MKILRRLLLLVWQMIVALAAFAWALRLFTEPRRGRGRNFFQ